MTDTNPDTTLFLAADWQSLANTAKSVLLVIGVTIGSIVALIVLAIVINAVLRIKRYVRANRLRKRYEETRVRLMDLQQKSEMLPASTKSSNRKRLMLALYELSDGASNCSIRLDEVQTRSGLTDDGDLVQAAHFLRRLRLISWSTTVARTDHFVDWKNGTLSLTGSGVASVVDGEDYFPEQEIIVRLLRWVSNATRPTRLNRVNLSEAYVALPNMSPKVFKADSRAAKQLIVDSAALELVRSGMILITPPLHDVANVFVLPNSPKEEPSSTKHLVGLTHLGVTDGQTRVLWYEDPKSAVKGPFDYDQRTAAVHFSTWPLSDARRVEIRVLDRVYRKLQELGLHSLGLEDFGPDVEMIYEVVGRLIAQKLITLENPMAPRKEMAIGISDAGNIAMALIYERDGDTALRRRACLERYWDWLASHHRADIVASSNFFTSAFAEFYIGPFSEKETRDAVGRLQLERLVDTSDNGVFVHLTEFGINAISSYGSDLSRFLAENLLPKIPVQPVRAEVLRVLYLTASTEANFLQVDAEVSAVKDAVSATFRREQIRIFHSPAATPRGLLQGITEVRPHVVHFSGHSDKTALTFSSGSIRNPTGINVSYELLARALQATDEPPRIVILNSCDSLAGAEPLLLACPVVVGMSASVSDHAASLFAIQFYSAVAAGHSVSKAINQAALAVDLEGLSEGWKVDFLSRPEVTLSNMIIVGPN